MYINIGQIKKHLNIDSDFTEDDTYLEMLESVAEKTIEKHIDHSLADLEEDGVLPAPLLHAILLLIGNMYMNRESISFANAKEIPNSYEYLLSLFKDYSKKSDDGGVF